MTPQGYVRFPTIYQDSIAFVSEDDLWLVSSEGGRAERLTASVGRVSHPHFSPDGQLLAFVGREEGSPEVYVMSALGGPVQRLTFHAPYSCRVLGWSPTDDTILYTSNAGQFISTFEVIYAIHPQGGQPRSLPFGMANAISYGPHGAVVLGRNIGEPAHWKRYRGGKVGHLWCDATGSGNFQRLLDLRGNIADPCWVEERIYFLSDHEGVGNIYSCTPQGEDLCRHSDLKDFYARNLSTDGHRCVFHAGADLYLFDPSTDRVRRLDVLLPSMRTQRNRKFVSAAHYLDSYELHPRGHALALTTRGKAFTMSNWEGGVIQHGEQDGVRYRFLQWLNDGKRLVAVCDAPGRETLIIFDPEEDSEKMLLDVEFGRAVEMAVCPTYDAVAISNHRQELVVVDLETGESAVLDRSDHARIYDLAWSPDGSWLAYTFALTAQKTAIKLGDMETGETHVVTDPVLSDVSPSFDLKGKYLYFLGYRTFDPVHDNMQLDYNFPRGVLPYAIPLQRDMRSPFVQHPKLLTEREEAKKRQQATSEDSEPEEDQEKAKETKEREENGEDAKKPERLVVDLEGITGRAVPFPVKEGRFSKVRSINKGKVLFLMFPVQGMLASHEAKGWIESYDFETQRTERFVDSVDDFEVSRDGKTVIYASRRRLRVLKAGEKPPRENNSDQPGRENGWLDLDRVKVSVQPAAEWKQMFTEAWAIQREQFWTEDMSGVDWDAAYAQYGPLIERIGSRSELSDLFKELYGELETSHAYESGGEYRRGNYYHQGFLGIDWSYDEEAQRYRIAHIVRGDPSDSKATSPLTAPGLDVAEGDTVLAINGQRVGPNRSPQELLVNQADQEVQLTIESAASGRTHIVTVTALTEEYTARYREWVDCTRRKVHECSQGRVGYIHIPDMGAEGYAEFHRAYLTEYDYPALLIDVRWNRGGHVSGLLLEKLARRRIGYKFSRWRQPTPYPRESLRGPMVALTNEHAASDGDIFSHSFKLMGLGPLIGMRTWGGVIGISHRYRLVDGTRVTQPENANWFKDVGWNLENYGTDPDIEVDIAPQDYANGRDPQLERAIAEAMRIAEEYPALEPKPGEKPRKGRF